MPISVEEIGKIRDFVLKQVMEENRCLVIGPEDLINRFCEDTGIRVDYIMTDSLNIDNETESEPAKIYNQKTKEVLLLSLTDRDFLLNVITMSRRMMGMGSENEEKTLLRHILGVQLEKERYRDGYKPSANIMFADSEKEKIEMLNKLFRRPPGKTIDEMRKLLDDRSVIDIDRRFDDAIKQLQHTDPEKLRQYRYPNPNERLANALNISEKRLDKLHKILIELSGKSTSVGELDKAEEINDMDHEIFLDLLEKEEGLTNREKLYLAFNQGSIMENISMELNEKFFHLEQDNDERIKSIGRRHACEIRKSDTIIKIDRLGGLNLREKLKACLWAGIHNQRFYGKEDEK